jgi:hypothetical protein
MATPNPRAAVTNISALPVSVALSLYKGDDFTFTLTVTDSNFKPSDLTGATAEAQVRVKFGDPDPPLASFEATITGNVIALHLSGIDSAALPNTAVWDCQLTTADGTVTTLAGGSITMTGEVTK